MQQLCAGPSLADLFGSPASLWQEHQGEHTLSIGFGGFTCPASDCWSQVPTSQFRQDHFLPFFSHLSMLVQQILLNYTAMQSTVQHWLRKSKIYVICKRIHNIYNMHIYIKIVYVYVRSKYLNKFYSVADVNYVISPIMVASVLYMF